jgi:hypothetical protein
MTDPLAATLRCGREFRMYRSVMPWAFISDLVASRLRWSVVSRSTASSIARRNVSATLIHRASTFRLDSVTAAGGLWIGGELAGTEVFVLWA